MNETEYALDDDIAAIATALSPAALSIIRSSGKNAFEKAARIFSRPHKLLASRGNEIIHGWIVDGSKKIDEVVVCTYRAPKSFTGEDSVEIICHGGLSITMRIFKLFQASGFRQAKPGEFTFRSFIAGKSDLTKAEAVKEIIDAKTAQVAERAAQRLAGNLYANMQHAKDLILKQIAELDVQIEYPEDEELIPTRIKTDKITSAVQLLEKTISAWSLQKIFSEGAKLVLAGRPNAGKSLLFNALLNEERAIVSDCAGTTRDWLEQELNFNGLPIKLYDTAGLRFTREHIEQLGIDKTKQLSENADLILYLLDASKIHSNILLEKDDRDFLSAEKYTHIPKVLVFTKSDLLPKGTTDYLKPHAEKLLEEKLADEYLFISAKERSGIDTLVEKTYRLLISEDITTDELSVGTERQKQATEKALSFLQHALKAVEMEIPSDAVILDLEEALRYIAEITGELKSDDILNEIFSGFCVGK